jgi:hypothetical protein
MSKITIEKKNEEITFKRVNTTVEFEVNGKKVRVYITESWDDMEGSDYDIDEKDLATLTDLEHEAFGEEGMWNLVKMKDGEKLEVDNLE